MVVGFKYPDFNFTVIHFASTFLVDAEPQRVCRLFVLSTAHPFPVSFLPSCKQQRSTCLPGFCSPLALIRRPSSKCHDLPSLLTLLTYAAYLHGLLTLLTYTAFLHCLLTLLACTAYLHCLLTLLTYSAFLRCFLLVTTCGIVVMAG